MGKPCRVFYVRTFVGDFPSNLSVYVDEYGFIVKVASGIELSSNCEVVDLTGSGLLTLPGFIDLHVHLRDFNLQYKETIGSGTLAAVSGGYVLVGDMPNTNPYIDSVELLLRRVELARRDSYVDYSIYCGIPKNTKLVEELLRNQHLFIGFKLYPEDLRDKAEVISYILQNYDGLLVVHAELPEYALRGSIRELSLRYLDRPSWNELSVAELLRSMGGRARLHITHSVHPSTPIKCKSLGITVDTAPYYFMLSSEDVKDCWSKINPPINDLISKSLIFKNVIAGLYDAVVSDHAPHTYDEKVSDWRLCPAGFAAIEVTSRIILTLFTKGFISHHILIKYLCEGPAKVLGVQDVFGRIGVGCRASFAVVDLNREGIARVRFSKAPKSGLDGFKYRGEVVRTVVGGEVVYDSGEVLTRPEVRVFGRRTSS
ncbi:MAG: dihydroorotase [Sulfolobales archaeon]